MNQEISIVFPNQLFDENPALKKGRIVYLIEDELFFSQYRFHKMKLVMHRVTMRNYYERLVSSGYNVKYIEDSGSKIGEVLASINKESPFQHLHLVDPVDNYLTNRINKYLDEGKVEITKYPSPQFYFEKSDFDEAVKNAGKKKYYLTHYYTFMRKKYDILLDESGSPLGGKWTFDTENRKKIPKDTFIPTIDTVNNVNIQQAVKYIEAKYPLNPGSTSSFHYPTNSQEAKEGLVKFLEERFRFYGDFQDAIDVRQSFLFHSLLSAPLNNGLITPAYVIEQTIQFALENSIPINSFEGFIRQIIGWREFFRGIYEAEGSFIRNQNFFNYETGIPNSFYEGTTGILPFDDMIKKVDKWAYANHIERLMIAGNLMLLCGFQPNEVYRWFMELFIDAYDWVMVPNVYSMSQYADGGLLTTKPYISGSNYIHKMSHYKKAGWSEIWDALYWRFLKVNEEHLRSNARMRMMYSLLNKKDTSTMNKYFKVSEDFLSSLT